MAYNTALEERLLAHIGPSQGVTTRKMFGGLCVMLNGNMVCGIIKDDLMVRIRPDDYEAALQRPGARPMDFFTGRPMRGMLCVDSDAVARDEALGAWVDQSMAFAASLKPK